MTKTFIVKNDKLPDYFVELDKFQDIRNYYERGRVIVFDNIGFFDQYKEFLNNQVISFFTDDIKIKKIKGPELLKKIDEEHILLRFTKKPWDLQKIILDTYMFVKSNFFKLFPHYEILSENWTWRLTTTKNDAMHLDSYAGQSNDLHNVRIFINLDNEPRIWRTTYLLPELYMKYHEVIKNLPKDMHPNEINAHLNKAISWDKLPFHQIHFAPFSMWLCDSQFVSHQGLRGNKLAAYTFRVSPETMLHPELSFEKIGRYHAWEALHQQPLL
jgi:hypothetical protein